MSSFLITLGLLVALVAGFFFGRWHGMSSRSKQLSDELEQKENELAQLKKGVDEHFDETAKLFSNLTEEYKALYQHLASSAGKLTERSFQLSLSSPEVNDKISSTTEDKPLHSNNEEEQQPEISQPLDYASEDSQVFNQVDSSEKKPLSSEITEEESKTSSTSPTLEPKNELSDKK